MLLLLFCLGSRFSLWYQGCEEGGSGVSIRWPRNLPVHLRCRQQQRYFSGGRTDTWDYLLHLNASLQYHFKGKVVMCGLCSLSWGVWFVFSFKSYKVCGIVWDLIFLVCTSPRGPSMYNYSSTHWCVILQHRNVFFSLGTAGGDFWGPWFISRVVPWHNGYSQTSGLKQLTFLTNQFTDRI